MKITALEEYGLRCLLQLAKAESGQVVSAETLANREGLSAAYVEKILGQLKRVGLVKSARGILGGYCLSRSPKQIRIGDMVRALDGDFFTSLCHHFSGNQEECTHIDGCSIRPVWLMVARHVYRILDHLTLQDLLNEESMIENHLYLLFPLEKKTICHTQEAAIHDK